MVHESHEIREHVYLDVEHETQIIKGQIWGSWHGFCVPLRTTKTGTGTDFEEICPVLLAQSCLGSLRGG